MAMAGKQKKRFLARTKTQGRLLLLWVVFVCPMPHGRFIWAYGNYTTPNCLPIWPLILACLISRVIVSIYAQGAGVIVPHSGSYCTATAKANYNHSPLRTPSLTARGLRSQHGPAESRRGGDFQGPAQCRQQTQVDSSNSIGPMTVRASSSVPGELAAGL
jgi:hypothetical protein